MSPLKKQIFLCTAGIAFEWYDFSLFATLAIILSHVFFPESNHAAAMTSTFFIFAIGFIMRPLGAVFFGHLGDKIGRKSTLLLTIFLMTISTTAIGIIPKETMFSIYLLLICRLVQGFAASGEYGGGITLLYEQSSSKKGFISSFGLFAAILGIFFGTSVVAVISTILSQQDMVDWGWRIPFILSLPLGIISFVLRASLLESKEFEFLLPTDKLNVPIKELFIYYKGKLIALLLMYALGNISFYINFIYLSNYSSVKNQSGQLGALYISSIITLLYGVSILFFGAISDFLERKIIMKAGCALMILFIYPIFQMIMNGGFGEQLFAQSVISILIGMVIGPLAGESAECFSTNVRYSGVGMPLNLASSIFGGTTPLICAWLVAKFHDQAAPSYYFILSATIALGSLIYLTKQSKQNASYLKMVNSV